MEEVKNATFLIKSSSQNNRSFGTGFCVHKDEKGCFLLTAGHVVESCGRDDLLVESYSATLLHISDENDTIDLALIYVEGLTNIIPLKLSDEVAHKGDSFTVVGYRHHKNKYAKEPLSGSIKKAYSLESKTYKRDIYELSINEDDSIEQGYSGSAVVSAQTGLVMAVATDRKRDGKNAYATPIRYLKEIWEEIPFELTTPSTKNPYKGLNSFEYKDRENYYGREKESKEIAKALKSTKLFTLLGASGSGKSSLVFAGILPLIKEDEVEVLSFRPQSEPFKNLGSLFIPTLYPDKLEQIEQSEKLTSKLINADIKLDNLVQRFLTDTKSKHLYLIIDQFEELFTMTKEAKTRNSFLDQLLTLVNSELNVTLLISMRADFLSHISYYEPFSSAYNTHPSKMLSLLNKQSLKKVIEEPVLKVGVSFQDGLVDRIINEIEDEAGQLPLLEFALDQLWEKKTGRVITHDVLDGMKSISASISHYADSFYERHAKKQESIKKVFMKLVTTGCGEEDIRRVAFLDEFDKEERETIVLLANERLVVTQDEKVDIVHEAFIREWTRLYGWIESYREFLDWEKSVRDDRLVYVANKEKKEDLLRESKLFRAKEFLEKYKGYISLDNRKFIEKSMTIDKRKKRKRVALLSLLFVVMLGVIGVVWGLKSEADREKIKAEELSKKLVTVVDRFFGLGVNASEDKKLGNLEIYKLIIDEFGVSKEAKIVEIVGWAYNNMGNAYDNQKEYAKAIEAYEKAVVINPKNDEAYYNMGIAYGNQKEYAKAIEAYEKAVAINPKKDETYYNMGVAYSHLGEFEKVIDAYMKTLKINPNQSSAYVNLFELQLTQNELFDQALEAKYIELFQNQKESFIKYEMLKIFQIIASGKGADVQGWKQKYRGVTLGNWSFDELREWIDGVGDDEIKARLLEALGMFEGHG